MLRGLVPLARPLNCAMSFVGVLIGGVVAVGAGAWGAYAVPLLFAALAASAFTAAGNALNDIYDRETDRVNHPERPIPSGDVRLEDARVFSGLLFLAAGALGFVASPLCLGLVILNWFIMMGYEVFFKALGASGNVLIAYLVGSLFLFAGLAVFRGDLGPLQRTAVLALLASLTTVGREITKDIEDIAGDVDRRTLPQRIGAKPAGRVAAASLFAGVALSVLPWYAGLLHGSYAVIVLLADGMFIYAALYSAANPTRSQRVTKYGMIVALVAFLAGGLL